MQPLDAQRAVVREQWARPHACRWAKVSGRRMVQRHRSWLSNRDEGQTASKFQAIATAIATA